jgi:hypothetical protein
MPRPPEDLSPREAGPMSDDDPGGDAGDGRDEGDRRIENLVLAGFFVVLVAAGVWLLMTMADVRQAQDCAAQGRRNCATIAVPGRSR